MHIDEPAVMQWIRGCPMTASLAALLIGLAGLACAQPHRPSAEATPPVAAAESGLLRAGFLAKSLCSGLWVNHREKEEFLANDILLGADGLKSTVLSVDAESMRVTARVPGGDRITAVFHATHGCTLLPGGARDVLFDTTPIPSSLPPADSLDWPMGDRNALALPEGANRAAIDAAVRAAFDEDPAEPIHTRALLVVHRGRILAERYAEGFDSGSVQVGWSMGKSITSALRGVLVEKGWLGLDQRAPIAEWQAPGDPRAAITIRDLLQMSSGLDFVRIEPDDPTFFSRANHHFRVYFEPVDVFDLATRRPAKHPPGTVGIYRNGDPLSLGRILRETVEAHGGNYLTFPQRELFDRIGIRTMVLERDYRGNMILTGFDHAAARDWARFGLLHLQGGIWDGERVLPEGWTRFVSSPAPAWKNADYGGLFWLNRAGMLPGAPQDAYMAAGAFGQYTVILPSHDMVVVRLGYSADSGAVRRSLGRAISEILEVPSFSPR